MSDSSFSHREIYQEENPRKSGGRGILRRRAVNTSGMGKIRARITGLLQPLITSVRRYLLWLRSSRSRRELFQKLLRSGLYFGAVLGVWIVLYLGYILFTLPDVDKVGALIAAESTVITDRNGTELYRIHGEEDRTLVSLDHISDYVEQATIAIEDQRFFERGCFDVIGFSRAAFSQFLPSFFVRSGGSTLTQQFSKNALIGTRKRKITRKLREYILSCQLERRYSKSEILEFYLNRIPYGNNAHGVERASMTYFAKSSSGLTLAEASVLAALPQLPTYLSPYGENVRTTFSEEGTKRFLKGKIQSANDVRDNDFWLGIVGQCFVGGSGSLIVSMNVPSQECAGVYVGGRTDQVLRNMQDQRFITEEERSAALKELQSIIFRRARENIRAPHFVFFVKEFVEEKFRGQFDSGFLESGGLTVTTTLDWDVQKIAERVVNEVGKVNEELYDAHNAALLAADPKSGQILAYVGNRDYWDEAANGNVDVIRSPRQPGSSFKPFVYAAAFLNGASPATVLYDIPTQIGDDMPENFDNTFWGPLTVRRALGASRNVPAAKAFFLAGGEDAIVELASSMGVPTVKTRRDELTRSRGTRYEYGWPLALGAAEVPLYEMVQGYTTFARLGKAIDLLPVLKIEDRRGNILYEAPVEAEERDVLDPRTAAMITSILSDESVRPEGFWREQLTVPGFPTAAKTGTSNKCLRRDQRTNVCLESKPDNTWTIGYTPALIAGAWAGNASGGVLSAKATGLTTDTPIWRQFMMAAHKHLAPATGAFPMPEGLTSAQISELSGKLASPCTPLERRRAELFFEGQAPKEFDDACVQIEIDKLTGLLASNECPVEAREAGSFFQPKSELPERWPLWETALRRWAGDLSRSPVHARTKLADLVEPINIAEEKSSVFWKTVGIDETGNPVRVLRSTGAFLPLPLPLAPTEQCKLSITPGRLTLPTLRIVSPSDGGSATTPSFRPDIQFTVGRSVRDVLYELDGRLVARTDSGSTMEPMIRLPRRFDASGMHTLKVTLTDSYFNQVSDSVRFTFREDEGTPQVRIIEPVPGSSLTIGSQVTIRAEAEDPGGSIDRVQFFLGDQLLTTRRGSSPYELTFTLTGEAGASMIRVIGIDDAKNEGVDEVEVTIVSP